MINQPQSWFRVRVEAAAPHRARRLSVTSAAQFSPVSVRWTFLPARRQIVRLDASSPVCSASNSHPSVRPSVRLCQFFRLPHRPAPDHACWCIVACQTYLSCSDLQIWLRACCPTVCLYAKLSVHQFSVSMYPFVSEIQILDMLLDLMLIHSLLKA